MYYFLLNSLHHLYFVRRSIDGNKFALWNSPIKFAILLEIVAKFPVAAPTAVDISCVVMLTPFAVNQFVKASPAQLQVGNFASGIDSSIL